jgi:hypothetical protein
MKKRGFENKPKRSQAKGGPIQVIILCDAVVIATPTDLRRKIRIGQPTVRIDYDFNVDLHFFVDRFVDKDCDFLDIPNSL